MRATDQGRVTNAIAAAKEFIKKHSDSALGGMVIHELHAAIVLIGQSVALEVNSLNDEEFAVLVSKVRDRLSMRGLPSDASDATGTKGDEPSHRLSLDEMIAESPILRQAQEAIFEELRRDPRKTARGMMMS